MLETKTIKRGNAKTYSVTLKDKNGNAVDVTGWTVYFTVKKSVNDKDSKAVISKTVTFTDALNGIGKVTFTAADTDKTEGTYYYDVKVINATGDPINSDTGKFVIESRVKHGV